MPTTAVDDLGLGEPVGFHEAIQLPSTPMSPMVRRPRVALSPILASYLLGFLAVIGHHSFWRSHGDLANVLMGGLVFLGALTIAVNVWAFRRND
jgi:hypothetical protein